MWAQCRPTLWAGKHRQTHADSLWWSYLWFPAPHCSSRAWIFNGQYLSYLKTMTFKLHEVLPSLSACMGERSCLPFVIVKLFILPGTDPATELVFKCRLWTSDLCSHLAHPITKAALKRVCGWHASCCEPVMGVSGWVKCPMSSTCALMGPVSDANLSFSLVF